MKVLILGVNGQVGSELRTSLLQKFADSADSLEVVGFKRSELDLTDYMEVNRSFRALKPDFIINAAAYTMVDAAESQEDLAYAVNDTALGCMAAFCKSSGCRLIHISTDYVFDGKSKEPYLETDATEPLSVYGRSKLAGENIIRDTIPQHIILRTSWVFGVNGKNFVKTMLRVAKTDPELGVVADQIGGPTSAGEIANTIASIVERMSRADVDDLRWGTYHYCGVPYVSWADFAEEIFDQAISKCLVKNRPLVARISSEQYPTPAPRPVNSSLNCNKLKSQFGVYPDNWKKSLGKVLEQI